MVAALEVSPCRDSERSEILRSLDEEFIFSRGRTLSLAERLPAAFASPGTSILAGRLSADIVSTLLARPFVWTVEGHEYSAAMIGLVYTRSERRGQGCASSVLRAAADRLRAAGCEFAVLWTTQPAFYARLGWIGADCGLLGEYASLPGEPSAALEADDAVLAELYGAYAHSRPLTSSLRFRTLLPPACRRDVYLHGDSFAVVGRLDTTGYVYEFSGDPDGIPALWQRLSRSYARLYVNVPKSGAAHRRLSAQPDIVWREQRLAMWLPLAAGARRHPYGDWYVPFLDRI